MSDLFTFSDSKFSTRNGFIMAENKIMSLPRSSHNNFKEYTVHVTYNQYNMIVGSSSYNKDQEEQ